MKTIVIQRLTHDLDLVSWLEEIRDSIHYETTSLWIGFSFLCLKNSPPHTPIYIFAAKALATFHTKFSSPSQFNDFIDDLKGLSHHEILQQTFVATQDDNPFANSGYLPYKLVCSYIWIRK